MPVSGEWPAMDLQAIARDRPDAHWSLVEHQGDDGEQWRRTLLVVVERHATLWRPPSRGHRPFRGR